MLEIWKSLIEHGLGWQVIALLLGLIFWKPLTELVRRISSIKGPGFDFSAPPLQASTQLENKALPKPDILNGEIQSASVETAVIQKSDDPLPALPAVELQAKLDAVRNFGGNFPIVLEGIELIKGQLGQLQLPIDGAETGRILVRHLAVTQLMLRCERTHRLIYGSQIAALHLMDAAGVQPESMLRPIFEKARSDDPQFYGSYTFEDWIGFLIKQGAALRKEESKTYAVMVYGQSYLQYIGFFATTPKPH